MTDALPNPLVPSEVDLSDFPFIPLYIARLQKSRSWLVCKRRPELAFYLFNLWCHAWHARPAASIEDDPDVLADAAMCPPKRWLKLKDDLLRGWVACSDGRLYHPVVAKLAIEAYTEKLAQRARTKAANEARERERNRKKGTERDDGRDVDRNDARDVPRNDQRDVHQGTGKGQGRDRDLKPNAAAPPEWVDPEAWVAYVAMRDRIRKPMTARAKELAIGRLTELRDQGQDAKAVLEQSVFNSWQGLFAVKPAGGNSATRNRQESQEDRNRRAAEGWKPPEVRNAG